MIRFKACPKCRGDLYLNDDIYGKYWNCLQCGLTEDLDHAGKPSVPVNTEAEIRVSADNHVKALKLNITRRNRGTASKNNYPAE